MKRHQKQTSKNDDSAVTLGDRIDRDLFQQLKEKQQELKQAQEARIAAEEQKKREERRLKEKNKSFEELLNESHLHWEEFKK